MTTIKGEEENNVETMKDCMTIHVAVGSKNPCKIEAVRCAFEKILSSVPTTAEGTNNECVPKISISSYNVPSGVRDQPYGDEETKLGAKNRAQATMDAASSLSSVPPDFAVGIEGGVEIVEKEETTLWCMAWIAIIGSGSYKCTWAKAKDSTYHHSSSSNFQYYTGYGKCGNFLLPPEITRLVLYENMELGDADDQVFQRVNGKQGDGTIGKLTRGLIDRSAYIDHALILAFVPWIRPELYFLPPQPSSSSST